MSSEPEIDVTRAMTAHGHPNQPCSQKEIEAWCSRVDDINSAIHDFMNSDPEELERRRKARRAELQDKERARQKQRNAERYDVSFYRKMEQDEFIDKLLADADKKEEDIRAAAERQRREDLESVKNKPTEFERIALEEAMKGKARGNALVGQVKYAEAFEEYSNVLGMDPDDDALVLAVRNNRALTALKKSPADYTVAAEDASFVIQQESKNIKARMRRAAALSGLHRPKEAIVDLRVVLRCDSSIKEAKDMMLNAQREMEETEAADKVGVEDAQGAEGFVKALDALAATAAKLDKMLFVLVDTAEAAHGEAGAAASTSRRTINTKTPDSDLSAAGREALEHIVNISNALGLDDGFASLLRLRGGFQTLLDFASLLFSALVPDEEQQQHQGQAPNVLELSLALSGLLRVLASALSVERTATALFATTPVVFKAIRDLVVKMIIRCDNLMSKNNNNTGGGGHNKYVAISGAAMSSLAHMSAAVGPANWEQEAVPDKQQRDDIIFATVKTFEPSSPLLPDGLVLGASIMMAGDRVADQLLSRARNLGKVLFSALDACRTQRDFASPKSRAIATMLLRVSAKRELSADLGANAQKLVQLLAVLAAADGGVCCGMLMEGVLAALHNGVILCSIDRSTLAGLLANAAGASDKEKKKMQWIHSFLAATTAATTTAMTDSVRNSSSIVSKFLALLSKAMQSQTDTEAAQRLVEVVLVESSWFAHLPALCQACLDYLKAERDTKAVKLADADATSVDIVGKAAAQWVATLSQSNLLENVTLVTASLIMSSTTSGNGDSDTAATAETALAPLAITLIKEATSMCLPRVAGNAALWITQRLAQNKAAVELLRKQQHLPGGAGRGAGAVVATLFAAIKELSAQLYDAERQSGGDSAATQQAMLKSARKNIAVAVAKLSGEADFMQAFRDNGGAQLFSQLQLA